MIEFLHGSIEQLFDLQPRALTRTFAGSVQMWLVLPEHMPGKAALSVTKAALAGDPASAKEGQLGRLPGSVNVKPGKGCREEVHLREVFIPGCRWCIH